jgi:hypothetical protein
VKNFHTEITPFLVVAAVVVAFIAGKTLRDDPNLPTPINCSQTT